MNVWQRLMVVVAAMIAFSLVAGLLWRLVLGFAMPDYVGGVVGGLVAIPIWESLKTKRR